MSLSSNRIIVLAVTIAKGFELADEFREDLFKRLKFSIVPGKTTDKNSECMKVVDRKQAIKEIQEGSAIETSCFENGIIYSTMSDLEEALNSGDERRAVIYTDANGINQVESIIGRFDSIELFTVFLTDKTSKLVENYRFNEEEARESAMSASKANYNLVIKRSQLPKTYMMCDEISDSLNL